MKPTRLLTPTETAALEGRLAICQLAHRVAQHLPAGFAGDIEEHRRAMRAAGVNLDKDFRNAMIAKRIRPELVLSLLPGASQFSEESPRQMTAARARRISDETQRSCWRSQQRN